MKPYKQKNFTYLLCALRYDAAKRLEILREETTHLINSIQYRIDASESTDENPATGGSKRAFLRRLLSSSRALHREASEDAKEQKEYAEKFALSFPAAQGSASGPASAERIKADKDLKYQQQFEVMWYARVANKALVIAERLGDLHDRVEQFLQRTNPDHPDPTLRRRTEQGLVDKYLSELARWVHRDIILHCKEGLGAKYPHSKVPSTFQFWAYGHTSRHHAFLNYDKHELWCNAVENNVTQIESQLDVEEYFVSVALSYWIPEREPLVPILGHELAHQVLRSIYGRQTNYALLEDDSSELGRVYRRLTKTVEIWLSRRLADSPSQPELLSNLVVEVLCDSLSAVRFGYAYAYAWVIETLSDERFAQLFHDRYGMLRRAKNHDFDTLKRDVLSLKVHLVNGLPTALYRGRVLLAFLQRMGLEEDRAAKEFGEALEHLLGLLLDVYCDGDTARAAFEDEFSRDLARSVCDEVLLEHDGSPLATSLFVSQARSAWASFAGNSHRLKNIGLDRQVMNFGFRQLLEEAVAKTLSDGGQVDGPVKASRLFAFDDCKTLQDAIWRIEWASSRAHVEAEGGGRSNEDKKQCNERAVTRRTVRLLVRLGMDDYLFRSANPLRLFATLAEPNFNTERLKGGHTDSLDEEELRRTYDWRPVKQLDDALAAMRKNAGSQSVTVLDEEMPLAPNAASWVVDRVLDGQLLTKLIQGLNNERHAEALKNGEDALFIDLLRLAHVRDKQSSADDGEHHKYSVVASDGLLGRYDSFVLYKKKRSTGRLTWLIDSSGKAHTSCEASSMRSYAARTKRLIRVMGTPNEQQQSNSVIALMLVSLKWDASRSFVAEWMASSALKSHLSSVVLNVYLSDGWEDVVLVFYQPDTHGDTHTYPSQDDTTEILRVHDEVNKNPFVSSTETLFATSVLEQPPLNMYFRFLFRSTARVCADAQRALTDALETARKKDGGTDIPSDVHVRDMAGNKDFEISISPSGSSSARVLHQALVEHASKSCRIETRVTWSRPIEEGFAHAREPGRR
jgi:hypothetical protein